MAMFHYRAVGSRTGSGADVVRGTITADSPREARDRLRAQGLAVRDMRQQASGRGESALRRYLARRQAGKVTAFLQELATLLAADIPIVQALDTITRQHRAGRFQRAIMLLREHVAAGGGLAEAMAEQPELFDELCRHIVEVGENAGTLEGALERLVAFRRRAAGLKNRVASAMIYPCIVLAIGVAVSLFLMTYVVPRLLTVLAESGRALPWPTMVVKGASDLLLQWGWLLVVGALATAGAIHAVLRTETGRRGWDRLQLRIPVFGELIRKQAIARMAEIIATLLRSGLTFVRALQIARRTITNRVLRDALETCEARVGAGRDIAHALERTGAFPPLVIQIFAVGQASGRLEEMLGNLAGDYETQVDISANRLTALLEPVMMILLAVTVGFIAFATILPILEAGDVL